MDAAWQVLVRWGRPDGAARAAALPRGAAPDPGEPRAALAEVLAGDLDARARELLLAWLDAFAHHWPARFEEILGPSTKARRVLAALLRMAGVLLALGTPSAVAACTAFLRPVEVIIRESEVVVRADVVGAEPGHGGEPGHVTLRVLDVLQGPLAGIFITVPGRLADYRVPAGRRPPYAEIDCEGRAPGCASCFARTYKASGQYLLLLKGGTPYWAPLSPTNEEVSGPDDPWVTWVRRQLAR